MKDDFARFVEWFIRAVTYRRIHQPVRRCAAEVELITKDSSRVPTAPCLLPKGHAGIHFVGRVSVGSPSSEDSAL